MATDAAPTTRSQILSAAESVIRDRGLAGATTRAIAERAGCAEGSIYRYFEDKHSLFIEVVKVRFPAFLELIGSLPDHAGKGSVRRTLEDVVVASLTFYRAVVPMIGGALSQPKLIRQQRQHWDETGTGPKRLFGALSTYIRREQRLGRLSERFSAEHATRLLLGSSFSQAFLEQILGDDAGLGTDEHFAREVVRSLMDGIIRREPAR